MEFKFPTVTEVLKSLVARNAEEVAALQFVLRCAGVLYQGLAERVSVAGTFNAQAANGYDIQHLLSDLPEELRRYLYGLVEAMEIYQSIHGHDLRLADSQIPEKSIHELRQIRDMCLEDSLRSVY